MYPRYNHGLVSYWHKGMVGFVLVAIGCSVWATHSLAELEKVITTVEQSATDGAASQTRIDRLDEVRDVLLRDYKVVIAQLEDLREYNASVREQIADQKREMTALATQIEGVTGVEREISPLMFRMLESLEMFVGLDAPFLSQERTSRVARLKALMSSANVSVAEKFRKLVEAYQIENEYGRTIEAYRGTLGEGEEARTVDYLKVGRVALLYRTLNGDESGLWNPETRQWQTLDDSYDNNIRLALNMAREIIPPDLLILPLRGATNRGGADQ